MMIIQLTKLGYHLVHRRATNRVGHPTPLKDIPQLRRYLPRPPECAVTLVYDLDDAATGMVTVVRLLAGKYLHDSS